MAGSLSHPYKIKDVYTKLVFFDESSSTFKRDTGSVDQDLSAYMGHAGINKSLDYLKFTATATLSSGNLFELVNNGDTKFSVTHDGVLKLKEQTSVPTATEGAIYYKNDELFIGVSSVQTSSE